MDCRVYPLTPEYEQSDPPEAEHVTLGCAGGAFAPQLTPVIPAREPGSIILGRGGSQEWIGGSTRSPEYKKPDNDMEDVML
jgi:hypothetical protein